MKKGIIAATAAVVLLGGALIGGAAVTGAQTKKRLHALPQAWAAQWPMVKVLEQRYDKGLFSATQQVTLQFGCDSEPVTVTLRQQVRHGPLPGFSGVGAAVIDTELVLPEAARKAFSNLTDQPPFRAHTVVGLTGATHTHFIVPALKANGPEGQQVAFEGVSGDIDASGGTLRYDVNMPAFKLDVRDPRIAMTMALRGARLHGEIGSGGAGSPWAQPGQGEGELALFELQASPGAGAPATLPPAFKLALRQLHASSTNRLDKELFSSTGLLTGQGDFNDVKLDKIELQASVKRLHAAGYERLVQHMMDMSAATCGMARGISPQVMLGELQQDVAALLPHNPEYALDRFAVESGGRRAEFSYALGIDGATEDDAKMPLPMLFLGKGHVRAEARVPAAWVELAMARFGAAAGTPGTDPATQAEMAGVMLTKLSNDGFIERDGEMLHSRLSFEKGQMQVNGKPLARPPMP